MTSTAGVDRDSPAARVALAGAFVAVVLMSFGAVIVKKADLDGLSFSFWRSLGAAAGYVTWVWLRRGPITARQLRTAAPGGLFFALDLVAFYSAVKLTSAANATVINALQPAIVLVIVGPLFGERPRRSMYGWTALAMAGVALSVYSGADAGTGDLRGDLLALVAVFLFTAYFVTSKQARGSMDAVTYTAAMLCVASVVILPIVAAAGLQAPTTADLVWIAAMILVPGTGHLLTNHAHGYVPLSVISLIWLIGPGAAALVAWWLVDEGLVWLQVGGMVLTVAALAMVVGRPAVEVEPALPAAVRPEPDPA